ncbi:MAG TPA: hypothetical protein V6D48_15410 [Oculatellaceae cyanobacterium]
MPSLERCRSLSLLQVQQRTSNGASVEWRSLSNFFSIDLRCVNVNSLGFAFVVNGCDQRELVP